MKKIIYLCFLLASLSKSIFCLDQSLENAIQELDVKVVKMYVKAHTLSSDDQKAALNIVQQIIDKENGQKRVKSFFQSILGGCFLAGALYNIQKYLHIGEPVIYEPDPELYKRCKSEIDPNAPRQTLSFFTVISEIQKIEGNFPSQNSEEGEEVKSLLKKPIMIPKETLFKAVGTGVVGALGIYFLGKGFTNLFSSNKRQVKALAIKSLLS